MPAVDDCEERFKDRPTEAGGYKLFLSDRNKSGYKGVTYDSDAQKKPYVVELWLQGRMKALGSFKTRQVAALQRARAIRDAKEQEAQ